MPEEQLLQIAESMIKEKSFQDIDSIPNEMIDDKPSSSCLNVGTGELNFEQIRILSCTAKTM